MTHAILVIEEKYYNSVIINFSASKHIDCIYSFFIFCSVIYSVLIKIFLYLAYPSSGINNDDVNEVMDSLDIAFGF